MDCYHVKREEKKPKHITKQKNTTTSHHLRCVFLLCFRLFPQPSAKPSPLHLHNFSSTESYYHLAPSFPTAEVTWNKKAAVAYHDHTCTPSLVKLLPQKNSNSLIKTNPGTWCWNIYALNNCSLFSIKIVTLHWLFSKQLFQKYKEITRKHRAPTKMTSSSKNWYRKGSNSFCYKWRRYFKALLNMNLAIDTYAIFIYCSFYMKNRKYFQRT